MGLQSCKSLNFENDNMTKWHLNASPMAKHKEYYKGEGGGFPQVRVVVSFVNPRLPVARPCTKSVITMH